MIHVAGVGPRGLGWRGPHPTRKPRMRFSVGVSIAAPTGSVSLVQYIGPVTDQGPTDSCPGHSGATAAWCASAAAAKPLPWFPSPRGIYVGGNAYTRALDTPQGVELPPLKDEGSYLPDTYSALNRDGLRPMGAQVEGRFSDIDATTAVAEPTLGEDETLRVLIRESQIVDVGSQRLAAVVAALRHGLPVVMGTFVDSQVLNYTRGADPVGPPNRTDRRGGGHAAVLYAATQNDDGSYVLTVRSSWGSSYGAGGDWLASEAWLYSVDELHMIGLA